MTSRILLVEDAPDVQMIVADLLRVHGHHVVVASDDNEALHTSIAQRFDLMILDVMLPGTSGFELCQTVRERGFDGGILMLTARTQVEDRVEGLTTGADDYLIKPFDSRELLARVCALLRRIGVTPVTPVLQYRFGEISVDFERRKVSRAGTPVSLATKELLLLRQLVDHRGQVLSRDQLLLRIWHDQPLIGPRTVDVHIAWLRQKLEENPQTPRYIVTVRGEGYSFVP
jgi:two-component system alkaline phosphatase synthesis response regulator PhoP